MATTRRIYEVEPGSELARALEQTHGASRVLVHDGVRYRLAPEEPTGDPAKPDPWADYDPAKLRAGIEAAAGSITPEEAELWIADIYRWREEGTRPPDRP